MAEPHPGLAGWERPLAQLRAALPGCRAEMCPAAPVPPGLPRLRRRAEYRAGRLAAAAAAHALCGMPCLAGRSARGAPVWPAGLCGAISHCDGQAIALLGDTAVWGGLGIDIEQHLTPPLAQQIAPVALTVAEQEAFGADPRWVGLIFSVKESLFKALSPQIGQSFDFGAAELCAATEAEPPALRLTRDLAPGWRTGRRIGAVLLAGPAGVMTAVALPREDGRAGTQPRSVAPPSM